MDDGTILDIQGWHDEEGYDCDPEEAAFITFEYPDGKWGLAMLADFGGTPQ